MIIANAVTRGVAGTNLLPFLTEGWLTPKSPGSMGGAGNSWTFSLSELASGLAGGSFGQSGTGYWTNDRQGIMNALKKNFDEHGGKMLATVILTPMAFKIGKQLLNKPVILPANRLLKSVGIREVKV